MVIVYFTKVSFFFKFSTCYYLKLHLEVFWIKNRIFCNFSLFDCIFKHPHKVKVEIMVIITVFITVISLKVLIGSDRYIKINKYRINKIKTTLFFSCLMDYYPFVQSFLSIATRYFLPQHCPRYFQSKLTNVELKKMKLDYFSVVLWIITHSFKVFSTLQKMTRIAFNLFFWLRSEIFLLQIDCSHSCCCHCIK